MQLQMTPVPIIDEQNVPVSAACQHFNNCQVSKKG